MAPLSKLGLCVLAAVSTFGAACGGLTPERDAAVFLQDVADCIRVHREDLAYDLVRTGFDPGVLDGYCDVDSPDLSAEASDLVDASAPGVLSRVLWVGLEAAQTAAVAAGTEMVMARDTVDAAVSAFDAAAASLQDGVPLPRLLGPDGQPWDYLAEMEALALEADQLHALVRRSPQADSEDPPSAVDEPPSD